jgi:hypothetical protein
MCLALTKREVYGIGSERERASLYTELEACWESRGDCLARGHVVHMVDSGGVSRDCLARGSRWQAIIQTTETSGAIGKGSRPLPYWPFLNGPSLNGPSLNGPFLSGPS